MDEQSVNMDSWDKEIPVIVYTTPDDGFNLWQYEVPVLQIGINPAPTDTIQRRRAFDF